MQMATAMLSDICERQDWVGSLADMNSVAVMNSVWGVGVDAYLVLLRSIPGSLLGACSLWCSGTMWCGISTRPGQASCMQSMCLGCA